MAKITQFRVKNAKFVTFWRHEKEGQEWDSRKFGSKKRDCPSKIGTVGKYDDVAYNHPVQCSLLINIGMLVSSGFSVYLIITQTR